MPFVIKNMQLDKMELLSVVDKGASGDEENRPRIVLFKRKKAATKMLEAIAKIFKGKQMDIEKAMGLQQTVSAIDELGLSDEQKAGVLKLLEAFSSPGEAPKEPAQEAPAEKAEDEKMKEAVNPENPDEEKQPMNKRSDEILDMQKRHDEELAKRDARIAKLEEAATRIRLEKRADELAFLPGYTREETIDLLKRADGDEKFDAMLTKLAKASKDSPLLRAAGAVTHDENSAHAILSKRVKALQDADPTMNAAVAKQKVLANDPELYREVIAAQQ